MSSGPCRGGYSGDDGARPCAGAMVGFPDMIAPLGARAAVTLTDGPLAGRASVAHGAQGLVLSRRCGEDGLPYFEVAILFGNDRTATPIHIAADDHDVIARWRGHASDLGLPLMMEREDGVILTAYDQLGCVRLGALHMRRRNPATMSRRPRFLMRRKTGFRQQA
jgi:hypothetical protein